MESRSRQHHTGKSNLSSRGSQTLSINSDIEKSSKTNSGPLSATRLERLNDPIWVFRPFTPEGRIMDAHLTRPPILPKSIDSIHPPISDRVPRGRSRKTCPKEWEDSLQAPNFFETADFKTLLDDKVKEKFCRDFVERNKNRLWKFDSKYINQSPRAVCGDIVDSHEFIGLMRVYYIKEQSLNLGASDKVQTSLRYDNIESSTPEMNFGTSLSTSRTSREARMRTLLAPACQKSEHIRGYNHTSEYGNFSKFSALLLSNKGATR